MVLLAAAGRPSRASHLHFSPTPASWLDQVGIWFSILARSTLQGARFTPVAALSRRLARACRERVDFMAIVALDAPDFRTISDFRKRHLAALQGLFVQVLQLCAQAGLVQLGHVALDGTKVKARMRPGTRR